MSESDQPIAGQQPEPQWNPPPVPPTPTPPPAESFPPAAPVPPPAAPGGANFTQPDWNAAASNIKNFDVKSVSPLDLGIMGIGVLVFLLSFMSYYTYSAKVTAGSSFNFSTSASINAWDGGFFGWFGALASIAAAGILAAALIAKIDLPFNIRQVVLIAAGVAAVCIVLALLIVPGHSSFSGPGFKFDKGHGWAYWVSLLLVLGQAALSFRRFQETSSS